MGSTITEKILANASNKGKVSPGDFMVADVDYVMAHDSTGPLAMEGLSKIGKGVFDPNKVVIVFGDFNFTWRK